MPATFSYPLTWPSWRGVAALQKRPESVVGISRSRFSLAAKKQDRGGQLWRFDVTVPLLDQADFRRWEAWLLALNGREGTFYFGDPSVQGPAGTWSGLPVVDGVGQTGSALSLRGFTPDAVGVAVPGDYLQLGTGVDSRLYRVAGVGPVDADAGGLAVIDIWPRLRAEPADETAVVTADPVGVFELATNAVRVGVDAARRGRQFSFPIVEAL